MSPLIGLALQHLPTMIATIQGLMQRQHPEAPAPTDAEVFAAFDAAYRRSAAIDDAWLRAHPEP